MIKKRYPANAPEMKKPFQQAKSCKFTEKKHYSSSSNTLQEFFQTTYKSSSPQTTPHYPAYHHTPLRSYRSLQEQLFTRYNF